MMYRKDTGEILGVHIMGLHAADLIHEASNAIATGQRVQDIKFNVHAHPTLSEVLDELFKGEGRATWPQAAGAGGGHAGRRRHAATTPHMYKLRPCVYAGLGAHVARGQNNARGGAASCSSVCHNQEGWPARLDLG